MASCDTGAALTGVRPSGGAECRAVSSAATAGPAHNASP